MTEYYQGKDIGIRFDVFKDGKPEKALSAGVSVYTPDKRFIKDSAKTPGTEVRYILKGKNVEKSGEYVFVFDVSVRGMGFITHVVNVEVKKLPVEGKK